MRCTCQLAMASRPLATVRLPHWRHGTFVAAPAAGAAAASARVASSAASEPSHGAGAGASDLKRRMFSVMATSVGSRSIDEAPKKPATPRVRSRM